MKFSFLISLIFYFFHTTLLAQDKVVHVNIDGIKINDSSYIAITLTPTPPWYIYWKNPGFAGTATSFEFSKNVGELEWQAPTVFYHESDMISFGYSSRTAFFFESDYTDLNVKIKWVACNKKCMPDEEYIKLRDIRYSYPSSYLKSQFHKIPKKSKEVEKLNIVLNKISHNKLQLVSNYKSDKKIQNQLIPFPNESLFFYKENLTFEKNLIISTTNIDWHGEYLNPKIFLPNDNILTTPINLKFLFFNPNSNRYEVLEKNIEKLNSISFQKQNNIFLMLLFAFLGGLILNLMPCVLPVIGLKLFSLLKQKETSKSEFLLHNLSYSLGIFFTILSIATILSFLKKAGEHIGWGLHLQSPIFVAVMIIIIFIMALNFFGVFEFKLLGGNFIGNLKIKDDYLGNFFSGIFAVILSTPCSAPFLGTALTFAFTTNTFYIFAIFSFIALGLAFPFIIIGIFPKMIKFLPRPGSWMDSLKKILGIFLLLTIAWLYDVLLGMNHTASIITLLNIVLIFIFIPFYFKSKKLFFLPIILILFSCFIQIKSNFDNVKFEPWSQDKLTYYKTKQEYVFMEFTAKWCLTCKVNRALVIDTGAFKEIVKKYNIKLLTADFTSQDNKILSFLRENSKYAVPSYFIQTPKGNIISLDETISIDEITKAITISNN